MAYTPFDYAAVSGTDNPLTNLQAVEANMVAALDALISGNNVFGWNKRIYQPAGTYPPTDPKTPAQAVATLASNTNIQIRATYTWSGNKISNIVFEKTLDGGSNWDPMGDTSWPLGKVTFTYHATYTTYPIDLTWS